MLLAARNISSGGEWSVSQVRQKEVEVEESSLIVLADWVNDFPAVQETLLVHQVMRALVLGIVEGTFERHNTQLDAGHILATVADNMEIHGSHC